jgi:hypothetical protein
MTPSTVIRSSYEQDYLLWTEETVERLRCKKFDSLDVENLIEEVLDLGRSQKRELKSRLGELLEHLLKRIYVTMPDCYRGWVESIIKQRKALKDLLADSPSLKPYFVEVFDSSYQYALDVVRNSYPQFCFPEQWPFEQDIDALLTFRFWE